MPGIHEIEIDISDLKPGIYFCTLRNNEGMQTTKLLKVE
ncbi:MAG: T9SS type A sorting domain-containing protein [Bacteroidales bacterium]|nr:T9SS type A sorting domain-containing protein [Bacteroidales bacterium]